MTYIMSLFLRFFSVRGVAKTFANMWDGELKSLNIIAEVSILDDCGGSGYCRGSGYPSIVFLSSE